MLRCLKMIFLTQFFVSLFLAPAMGQESDYVADFTLQDTNNKTVTLGDYRDKRAVLLLFWTTWCPYCRGELKELKGWRARPESEDLEMFAVDVGESQKKVSSFTKPYLLNYKVLLDQDKSVARSFRISGVPTYILINQKGNVVFQDNYLPRDYKNLITQ